MGAAAVGIPLALWGGWDWLAATGLADVLIAVASCLVMCALGLCMAREAKQSLGPHLPKSGRRMRRHPASRRAAASVGMIAVLAAGTAFGAGDSERGAEAFRNCVACHTFEPGRHLSGPSLAGIWGREAGGAPGFYRYSDALKRSDLVWNEKTLDAWLRSPKALVPGNSMGFDGIPDRQVRADLLAFLKAVSEGKVARVPKPPPLPDLKKPSSIAAIESIRHCGDSYFVTNAKGQTAAYWEFNLRFKTDSSASGPAAGRPVMVGQGMRGDRAQIVFSEPREVSSFIKEGC